MRVDQITQYLSQDRIEARANGLLDLYEREFGLLLAPPVPVERIAELLLELTPDWGPVEDTEDEPVLAYINPRARTIRINEKRRARFDSFPGLFEFTLAHEVGHHELHVVRDGSEQTEIAFAAPEAPGRTAGDYLCREVGGKKDMRERQADMFAGYLLMPARLLAPAIQGLELRNWRTLYRLRDQFGVSISALTVRLKQAGALYVAPGGALHSSEAEAHGQMRLL